MRWGGGCRPLRSCFYTASAIRPTNGLHLHGEPYSGGLNSWSRSLVKKYRSFLVSLAGKVPLVEIPQILLGSAQICGSAAKISSEASSTERLKFSANNPIELCIRLLECGAETGAEHRFVFCYAHFCAIPIRCGSSLLRGAPIRSIHRRDF